MTVLTIDDASTLRKIMAVSLKQAGHSVEEAENGLAGLNKLATIRPDCIILDINMPVMGGIEFLIERNKNPAYSSIPVVVLTTQDEAPLRNRAVGLGAKAFLAKPFDKEQLLAAIAQALA